jgi:hypothetical protein
VDFALFFPGDFQTKYELPDVVVLKPVHRLDILQGFEKYVDTEADSKLEPKGRRSGSGRGRLSEA